MKTKIRFKSYVTWVLLLSGIFFFGSCTKTGENATALNRALAATDSIVFSQFYDSTIIATADATPDVNDIIRTRGVASIIQNRCATVNCHGGGIAPQLKTYNDIKSLVTAGNPEGSKLFTLITTNDLHTAMPPVYAGELTTSEKIIIYNWIKNGANEKPTIADFRPTAIHLIASGCASANCHNAATLAGDWARKGLLTIASSDTTNFNYVAPTGTTTLIPLMKEPKLTSVWSAYKDSAKKFFADTVANASFRVFKTMASPWTLASRRGPLNNYDDIIFDVMYPKSVRSNSSPVYTNPNGIKYYCKGDPYNATSSLVSRIDSTLLLANPRTKVWATSHQGDMAYGDGGLVPSEIAIIKAWYFADQNVPEAWKWGLDGTGIFKYRKSQNIITKK